MVPYQGEGQDVWTISCEFGEGWISNGLLRSTYWTRTENPWTKEMAKINLSIIVPNHNEKKVLEAIKILISRSDDIEIFNKKAIYLYIREITNLNTKQVVNSLNKMRKRYKIFKAQWDRGEH